MAFAAIAAVASVAVSAFGAYESYSGAQSANAYQQQQIGLEMKIQKQQEAQMALIANRLKLQEVRNAQIASSEGRTRSVTQGAEAGSGLQGGQAQIRGQEVTALTGLQQNYEIGRNIYGLTYDIDAAKIGMAGAQSTMATGQGLTSLGGAIGSNLGPINTAYNNLFRSPITPMIGYGGGTAFG